MRLLQSLPWAEKQVLFLPANDEPAPGAARTLDFRPVFRKNVEILIS